jgi:hypothetical protein
MHVPQYSFVPADAATARRARRWLLLGVAALGVAGVFAGLLANTKNPLFYIELVVHVDLSVLVWFLTMAGMLFTLALGDKGIGMVTDAAFSVFALGTALIVASAFTGGTAFMSNYIPVIYTPVFFLALGLLLCGMLLMAGQVIVLLRSGLSDVRCFAAYGAAFIMFMSAGCFAWSVKTLPIDITGHIYYEFAFWGGGHVLQFVHTQLMMLAWVWLARAAGMRVDIPKTLLLALFLIGPLAVLSAPVIYMLHDATTEAHREAFTHLMWGANGIAPLLLGLMLMRDLSKGNGLAKICFVMSFLLFNAGGGLGYLIEGSNLVVPAHYHGSIIGITIAFMGISYLLLPSFGFADVSRWKLAKLQPVIYGGGMLCWMVGMAILGEHGVARKTPGSADTAGKFVEFLKHGSDGLALIGGLLFVFIVLKSVFTSRSKERS